MTSKEFKKVGRILKEAYQELEKQALKESIDIFSDKYKELQDVTRETVLKKLGYSIEEYIEAKTQYLNIKQTNLDEGAKEQVAELLKTHIPSQDEIREIAHEVAKEYIKPPQITNEIVKEITIEKPIKETVIQREEYDSSPLMAEIGYLNERVDKIKIPDLTLFREEVKNDFGIFFEQNINTLEMPDFRKLAMGLQQQIDDLQRNIEAGDVDSVNGQTGTVVLTTSEIGEGSNLYYTQARFNTAFAAKSTSDLTEGTNLYFTNARAVSAMSGLYEVPLTFGDGLTRTGNDVDLDTTVNILKISGLTSNGFVKTSGGDGTLSIDTNTYLTGNQAITLSGDITGSGATSITTTLATVNSNVGSFGSSTSIPSFTVNAKGLITAASGNAVIAPAGTLTGTTLASNVVTSSLTSVGTLAGLTVTAAPTFSALTSGRIPYATTAGLLTDSTGLTYNGTTFSTGVINQVTSTGIIISSTRADVGGVLFATTLAANSTVNGAYLNFVYDVTAHKEVDSGVTDTGRLVGQRFNVFRNNAGTTADSGTLSLIQGLVFGYGNFNGDATATPTTTTVQGINLAGQSLTGTITTLTDILINANSGAGTVTTHVGIDIGALVGTTTKGLAMAVASGANKHNLYISGTADNYLEGLTGIGTTTMTGKFNVDQSSTTAAIPVLVLDQADVSEEMIEFVTTIGTGNAIEAVGAKTLTTTHFIKITIPGGLTRYIPCGTIA